MSLIEDHVEKMLFNACKKNGIKCPKSEGIEKGYPDRMVFNHKIGEIHYVEIKNNTYYGQTVHQKKWQRHIENSGGKYFLLDGEEEVKEYIQKYIL